MRIDDSDPRAAKVNETEQTMKPTQYVSPIRSNLAIWDLPGAGTESHPISTYFDEKGLLAFDCIVIVCE
jgi:hypothetical protein